MKLIKCPDKEPHEAHNLPATYVEGPRQCNGVKSPEQEAEEKQHRWDAAGVNGYEL